MLRRVREGPSKRSRRVPTPELREARAARLMTWDSTGFFSLGAGAAAGAAARAWREIWSWVAVMPSRAPRATREMVRRWGFMFLFLRWRVAAATSVAGLAGITAARGVVLQGIWA